jgi:hypothetical protein
MQALAPVMRGLMLSGKTDSVMDQAQGTGNSAPDRDDLATGTWNSQIPWPMPG